MTRSANNNDNNNNTPLKPKRPLSAYNRKLVVQHMMCSLHLICIQLSSTYHMHISIVSHDTYLSLSYSFYHTVFYRYKRAKIFDAYKSGDNSKDTIIRLTQCTPGLEGYNATVETYTSTQLMELSRGNIRAALLNNLAPKDSKRAHRKNPNSTMSFLEMNRIMTASWKSLDDNSRG